ncbi:winged helix-turn-helix domain-containing protein [Bradyrhizobium sp. Arg314]
MQQPPLLGAANASANKTTAARGRNALGLRISLDPEGRLAPGKIELLERIAAFGSISAAARSLEMSYKHAWHLVDEINRIVGQPVVAGQAGGKKGGGARLTPIGLTIVSRFRAIEKAANLIAGPHMMALQSAIDAADEQDK